MSRRLKHWLTATTTVVFLAMACGCATTAQTESLLAQAGFKAKTPKTPAQEQYLQSLPSQKLTRLVRNGTDYYVYPDRQRGVLYIGKSEQYAQFQKLKRNFERAEETNNPAAAAVTDFEVWSD
jgi:predicted RNA-binding protein YlxR (DUF448 family)